MIGAGIGTALALAILVIYRKDEKAVKAHKEQKLKKERQLEDLKQKRQEEMKKYLNGPKVQEKKQQIQNQFRNKVFSALNAEQRKVIEDYFKNSTDGTKSDSQVLKTTALKMACFLIAVLLFVIFIIVFVLVMKQQGTDIVQLAKQTVGTVYPRLADNTTSQL